jgi:thiosulfate dehydrogenase
VVQWATDFPVGSLVSIGQTEGFAREVVLAMREPVVTQRASAVWVTRTLVAVGAIVLAAEWGQAQGEENVLDRVVPMHAPAEETIPGGPIGDAIRYGMKVVTGTRTYARAYVGNGLNCSSCHLDAGRKAYASPWVGVWGVFPEYRSRNGKVIALQDRVNDCFQRSMNGKLLPYDSNQMRGILAYIWWLSRDVPTGVSVRGRGFARVPVARPADPKRGEAVYSEKCAECHGADGEGREGANGQYIFPALWGPKSFNIGAGMARLDNAAGFVKANMPLGQGNTLSDGDALDVAAYFTRKPRPDFPAKSHDWPKGDKPSDVPY